jgi:Tfp pilus assembly PilM family ATPase
MPDWSKLKGLAQRAPTDVVGVDFASNGSRAVRLKRGPNGIQVTAAALIDAFPALQESTENEASGKVAKLDLPPALKARFAALSISGRHSALKILRVPDGVDLQNDAEVATRCGLDSAAGYRCGHRILIPPAARTEGRVLGLAFPEWQAQGMIACMPDTGTPAPRAVLISELSVINAFLNDKRFADKKEAFGLLHFDQDFSVIALFHDGVLSQLRTFVFGVAAVSAKVMRALNIDEETAFGVLQDGAFDISHLLEEGTHEIRSQMVITRDFMERSENCVMEKLYLSGPETLTNPFKQSLATDDHLEEWRVNEAYEAVTGAEVEDRLVQEPWRMTAAIGAALSVLEAG